MCMNTAPLVSTTGVESAGCNAKYMHCYFVSDMWHTAGMLATARLPRSAEYLTKLFHWCLAGFLWSSNYWWTPERLFVLQKQWPEMTLQAMWLYSQTDLYKNKEKKKNTRMVNAHDRSSVISLTDKPSCCHQVDRIGGHCYYYYYSWRYW